MKKVFTKISNYLAGYKTKIIAFAGATITLLQVFSVTNFTEAQIAAILSFIGLGMLLAIRDTMVREVKKIK